MLTAIRLNLVCETETQLPASVGRASYAALLALLAARDPALAQSLHDGDGPKPVTCSDLFGAQGPSGAQRASGAQRPTGARGAGSRQRSDSEFRTLRAGEAASLRYTALTAETSALLRRVLLEEPPQSIRLDTATLRVTGALCDAAADAWSGSTSYEALAAEQITRLEGPDRSVRLLFASPTAFRSAGRTVPVPLPGLVFGSLVERWNAFSPVGLSGEMRRFGEEMIVISRYRLQSEAVAHKGDGLRIGGVGEVTYRALNADRYWVGVMQMLARFALYAGVGAQTTTGMGQVRRV